MYGKKYMKNSQQRWSFIWTLLLITHLYELSVAAPTKHLKVTADGDTPKLIVTSEEDFGTGPKRLVAAKSKYHRTTPTVLPTVTTTTTTTTTTEQNNSYDTDSIKHGQDTTTTTTTTTTTIMPVTTDKEFIFNNNGEKTAAIFEHVDTTKSTIVTEKVIEVANEANKMFQQAETTSETHAATSTTAGKMFEIQPTLKPMMQSKSMEEIEKTNTVRETTVKPLAPTTTTTTTMKENEKSENLPAEKQADNLVPPGVEPALDKLNDKIMMITHSEVVDEHVANDVATTVTMLPALTTFNSKELNGILSTTTTTTTTTLNMDIMLNDQPQQQEEEEDGLRLLDLEKQERKSAERQHKEKQLKQKHQSQQGVDVHVDDFNGHDGIKKTKKKQLQIDKHLLADIATTKKLKTNLDINVEKTLRKKKFPITDFAIHSLGPIHMDEKIYSIKQKQPLVQQQHETHASLDTKKPILNIPIHTTPHTTKNPTEAATRKYLTEQTESKISDIQVEIYDSTIDSIVASTSFKDNKNEQSTTKTPAVATLQERFTQYVIDRVESSTPESNLLPQIPGGFGNPEPAAIEIHINVSEGIGNGSEDLEFSYPQTNFEANESLPKTASMKHTKLAENKNYTNAEEVLVVEIIDNGENNSTDENIRPVFTFRTDQSVNEIELKNVVKAVDKTTSAHRTDELFLADVKHFAKIPPTSVAAPLAEKPTSIDRDSDTIFYISNTEVKVGESLPTSNTDTQNNSGYILSTHPNALKSKSARRYEEDILLSPLQNTADSLKIFRSQNEGDAPPLDVTYVGESVMEVEQLPPEEKTQVTTTTTAAPGHVIIQPATLSEIGVPVIGELPPQIELKEFDFMPDELTNHEQRTGGGISGAEEEEQPLLGNDVERLVESSIQYGGDLIDEGAVDNGGGFDGAEGSYPFGNLATMGRHGKQNAKRKYGAHLNVNHGVNNLRKDELSVDVGSADDVASIHLNSTLKDAVEIGIHNVSDASMNITFAVAERMTNATTASVMEDPKRKSLNVNEEYYWGILSLIFSIFIATLPVVTIFTFFCTVRYFYNKYQSNGHENSQKQSPSAPGKTDVGRVEGASVENSQDISRNARETKMHYNNCTGKDGVFVVEVSRGVDSQHIPEIPMTENTATLIQTLTSKMNQLVYEKNEKSPTKLEEEVQIHEPPRDLLKAEEQEQHKKLKQIKEVEEEQAVVEENQNQKLTHSNTGLSQSDLSSSSTDSNKTYNYGNQTLYVEETADTIKGVSKATEVETVAYKANKAETVDDQNKANNGQSLENSSSVQQQTIQVNNKTEEQNTEINGKHHETNSSESIEKDNQAQMQVTTEPVVEIKAAKADNTMENNVVKKKSDTDKEQQAEKCIEKSDEKECLENEQINEKYLNCNKVDIEPEPVYDSLMSLPEPPSFEEIKQLSDINVGETNQLDSLPLPPPPPLFEAEPKDSSKPMKLESNGAKQIYLDIVPPPPTSCLSETLALHVNNSKEMLSTQLTPPESPPTANCANSRGSAGICVPLTAVAVDVNGS